MWVQCCFVPVLQVTSISVPNGWVLTIELLVFNISLEVCFKITDFKKTVTCSKRNVATSLRVIHSVFNYYTIATIEWTKQKHFYQHSDWMGQSLFAFYHWTAHIPLNALSAHLWVVSSLWGHWGSSRQCAGSSRSVGYWHISFKNTGPGQSKHRPARHALALMLRWADFSYQISPTYFCGCLD